MAEGGVAESGPTLRHQQHGRHAGNWFVAFQASLSGASDTPGADSRTPGYSYKHSMQQCSAIAAIPYPIYKN